MLWVNYDGHEVRRALVQLRLAVGAAAHRRPLLLPPACSRTHAAD